MISEIVCSFPVFAGEEEALAYLKGKAEEQAAQVAEREQVIVTKQREDYWIATLAGDWRSGTGATEERAVGALWLLYSHEIIEKCWQLLEGIPND